MTNRSRSFFIANIVLAPVFLLCVAVQYNDPDPLPWMAMYGLAALACLLYVAKRLRWHFSAAIGVIALIWAATILPRVSGKPIPWNQVFGTMEMISSAVEETREIGGLLIVAGWMLVLTLETRTGPGSV